MLWVLQASQGFGPCCNLWLSLNPALPFFVFSLKPDFSQMFPVYICLTAFPPDLKGAGHELLPNQRFVARFSVKRLEHSYEKKRQSPATPVSPTENSSVIKLAALFGTF